MRPFLLTLTALAAMAVAAQDLGAGVTLSAIMEGFEARGQEVTNLDVEGSRVEVEAVTPDGARVEAIVERATGDVLDERADD